MTRKPKILFCIDFFNMTGATASLVALLKAIDCSRYDVSLFRFDTGDFCVDQIPPGVRQLPLVKDYVMYSKPLPDALRCGLRRGWWALAARRLVQSLGSRLSPRFDKLSLARLGPRLPGDYDVVIAFCCSYAWEFICTKVSARKRVAWLDTNHHWITGLWERFRQLETWDRVACVCRAEAQSLEDEYPPLVGKTAVVHNVIDRDALRRRAEERPPELAASGLTLLTVGRVTPQKGQDFVIETALELKRRGRRFTWYLIGPGEARWREYLAAAGNPDLSGCVVYLGPRTNPVPEMKACSLYVQPSRFEGWGMTVTEALACGAPVLVSDIPPFREQVADGVNGWIAPLDATALADRIEAFADGRAALSRPGAWLSDYATARDFDVLIDSLADAKEEKGVNE